MHQDRLPAGMVGRQPNEVVPRGDLREGSDTTCSGAKDKPRFDLEECIGVVALQDGNHRMQ